MGGGVKALAECPSKNAFFLDAPLHSLKTNSWFLTVTQTRDLSVRINQQ